MNKWDLRRELNAEMAEPTTVTKAIQFLGGRITPSGVINVSLPRFKCLERPIEED